MEEKCWVSMVGPTLPEGEEDDSLDGDELEDWLERTQQIHGGEVEEEKGIKGQADREVVDDGDVEVSTVDTVGRERENCCPGLWGAKQVQLGAKRDQMGKGRVHSFAVRESTAQEGEEGRGSSFSSVGGTSFYLLFYLLWLTGILSLYCLGAVSLYSPALWAHSAHCACSSFLGRLAGHTGDGAGIHPLPFTPSAPPSILT